MNIDRNNYEMYFLDYLEGRLTTDETAALLLFADENPDLKELLEDEEMISLVPDEKIGFSPKSALKKNTISDIENEPAVSEENSYSGEALRVSISAGNYEEFMIRYYENELEEVEKAELANFLKDSPTFIKEFELFGNTLLKADTAIGYPHKSRLKRKLILLPQTKKIFAIVSVAASVLLFSTLFLKYINQPNLKEQTNLLAGRNDNRIETVKPVTAKTNIASIHSTDITPNDKSEFINNTSGRTGISSKKPTVIRQGFEPGNPNSKQNAIIRSAFEAPSSLMIKQSSQLASADIKVPNTINRRTDFDGITATAYYDPDPEALPIKAEGRNISGRLGQTLASGISQTAGTIAREPELGRLLRGKVSLSDLASLGIAGFNLITDSKLAVSRKYDKEGNMKGYSIVDENKRIKR
jgi:hypothetical protein